MVVRLNRRTAREAFEAITKDLDLKVCLPRRRDPGGTSAWQHTVRIECQKDSADWKAAVVWAKSKGYILAEWRDINDKILGLEITDVVVETPHQRDHIVPREPKP